MGRILSAGNQMSKCGYTVYPKPYEPNYNEIEN